MSTMDMLDMRKQGEKNMMLLQENYAHLLWHLDSVEKNKYFQ